HSIYRSGNKRAARWALEYAAAWALTFAPRLLGWNKGLKRPLELQPGVISIKFPSGFNEPLGLLFLTKLFCLCTAWLFSALAGIGFVSRRHRASHLALVVS